MFFRQLFPALRVRIHGLEPVIEYTVSLRISSADPYRYKFLNTKWVAVEESEVMQNEDKQIFRHPNSPNNGEFWMKKPISFKDVKITHDPSSTHAHVGLQCMYCCLHSSSYNYYVICAVDFASYNAQVCDGNCARVIRSASDYHPYPRYSICGSHCLSKHQDHGVED